MTPKERNTRRLIGVLAEHFPAGSDCQDLRLKFQEVSGKKHATFYACLHFAKANNWIISEDGKTYSLNPNGCWRPPPIGAELERHQFEHVLTARTERIEKLEAANRRLTGSRRAIAAGEAAGIAVSTLVGIMSDPTISTRRRLQAAQNLLEYKTPPDIAESAKLFLASVFTNREENIDHRLAATTALRRSEDPRIMPTIERPPPVTRTDDPEPVPLMELVRQRRERADRMERERLERERLEREMSSEPTGNNPTSDLG